MENADLIEVEVAYAKPDEQLIIKLDVAAGTTLQQAIEQSGILDRFPEIDPDQMKAGVFGKLKKLNQSLRDGDRVEIYRPLKMDPKEARRRRAG